MMITGQSDSEGEKGRRCAIDLSQSMDGGRKDLFCYFIGVEWNWQVDA